MMDFVHIISFKTHNPTKSYYPDLTDEKSEAKTKQLAQINQVISGKARIQNPKPIF